ncbi:iron complex outermembrane receptor protein [Rhodoblastus sphagnicola]|nr:TonB-dependent receptor [Rhodoblastus sphagnicola]MBB4197553.1 iron complex outermembrane receptor protein [Rhodoblastus sphagnicola]
MSATAMAAAAEAETVIALPDIEVTSSPIFTRPPATQGPGVNLAPLRSAPPGLAPIITQSFAPITVAPKVEIERNTPKTLGEALADKPGISASSFAPGASRPVIRGLDSVRVRVQENGIGAHDVSELGDDHGVAIDPMAADQIEVVRGPATLRYGAQAIGGVVNVSNNRIPTFIPVSGYSGNITGSLANIDKARDLAAALNTGVGPIALHADGFVRRSDNYGTPAGVQANSAFFSQGGSVGSSYLFDQGFFGVSYTHFDADYQIPGGQSADEKTHIVMRQDKLQAKGEYRPQSGPFEAFRLWFGATDYRHDERGLDAAGADAIQATFKNQELETRIEAQHAPVATDWGALRGAVGVQAGLRSIGTSGDAGGLLGPALNRSAAAFVFEELELSKTLRAQAAARIDKVYWSGQSAAFPSDDLWNGTDPVESGARKNFTPHSFSFGLLQTLPQDVVASLTGQYVERAPTGVELFAHGAHDASGTFEIGDADLKKEVAQTIEFALRRKEGALRFDGSVYATRYNGFIYRRLTGVTCGDDFASCGTPGGEFRQTVYSQTGANFHGLDLATQYDVMEIGTGVFGVDGRYDFVHARFDDGSNAPRIPPHRLGGGLFWRDGDLFARASLLHAFAHTQTAPLETATPGYNLLKAELSYTHRFSEDSGAKALTVSLVGNNLLNSVIRDSTSFKKDEVMMQGRGIKAAMTLQF